MTAAAEGGAPMSDLVPTPGPWSVNDGALLRVVAALPSPVTIAGVHRIRALAAGDALANAYLIAGAPRLFHALASLEALARRGGDPSGWTVAWDDARLALGKCAVRS
jgi:hypothetical protein